VQVLARFKELPALAEHATPELEPEVERKLAARGDYTHAFIPGAFISFKGARDPPLSPDEFASRAAAKTVTNGKDKATLVELQAKVTSAVLGNVLELNYLDLGWKAAEMAILAGALPMCAKLRSLDLMKNPLGEGGLALLGPELGKLPQLMTLSLQNCGLDPGGARAVAAFCAVSTSITHIGEGGLDLRGNNLGDEGWGAIFAGVCSSKVSKITSIDASGKGIGPKGAKLIAEALRTSVNASVTLVWTPAHQP
jgi:hypothetical protein